MGKSINRSVEEAQAMSKSTADYKHDRSREELAE
jgi:hypothetical protein